MGKERLSAFIDAVLAIIITILVLDLPEPEAPTWAAIWDRRTEFAAYTLSFFWLGSMWIHQHNRWDKVDRIDRSVVRWALIMLFFAPWFPYTTRWVNEHFHATVPQLSYGFIALMVSLANAVLSRRLAAANSENTQLAMESRNGNRLLAVDMAVKCCGFALAFLYPPAMMVAILLAAAFIDLAPYHLHKVPGARRILVVHE